MPTVAPSPDIFSLPPITGPLPALVGRTAERLLALDRCRRVYARATEQGDEEFFDRILDALEISCGVSPADLDRIPARGPVLVVANHPFGALEGIILASLLRRVRPDVRFMANYLLGRIPQLQPLLIAVDPFGGRQSVRRNLAPLRESLRWLQAGGMLVVFPAGEVSHLQFKHPGIADPEWDQGVARIVRRSGASVLPVFFRGTNGPLFHLAGLLHPRLRTALLPHELLNKREKTIEVRIGAAIPSRRLHPLGDRQMTEYLRFRTYLLGRGAAAGPRAGGTMKEEGIVAPQHPAVLREEIGRLPAERLLAESGPLAVLQAEAREIPYLLLEIGRLREITFRAVGEGTGRGIDLDRFDEHYTHLVLWNRETAEVAGAYRMGRTDLILGSLGISGLYTSTLFDYRPGLLEGLGPALEMGRSFVRSEYQKSYAPLLLLWKGIGTFVARHLHYRTLFGPVSISGEYTPLSRQLIATSLQQTCTIPELARLVQGKNPLRLKPVRVRGCRPGITRVSRDIEEVADLVADIEADRKGIPVLLRHYLGLGGKVLAFNVDPEFSNVLDGLVLVDLLSTEPKTLMRYLGREGVKAFYAWHAPDRATGKTPVPDAAMN